MLNMKTYNNFGFSTCDICGCGGVATNRKSANWLKPEYRNYQIRHSNPQICADNLARKAKELNTK